MADKNFHLDIVTPTKQVFSGDVDSVIAPGTEGQFQILHDHTRFLVTIQIGEIKVKEQGKEQSYATSGGFVEVHENSVSILAETAETAEDIDIERSREAEQRAKKRLEESHDEEVDSERARLALFRALNRMQIHHRVS
jgi:F-type H+-transporting ATPase subunit epsilon